MMKRVQKWIRDFFLPPADSPTWVRVFPYMALGVLTLVALTGGAYAWDYTNSPAFCGTSCHTMPPEYTAYQVSPHARIDCVDCHIGKGFIATRITRKAGDLKHVFATVFHNYEFPITAHDLRPARETCELCHSPDKFSDDSLRKVQRYENDSNNTPQTIYLVLKTGGGSNRAGLGRGIHWHIMNKVQFLALDPEEQEIPYVRVVEDDGSISEYVDVNYDINPATIQPDQLVDMDCITCHNRITHLVPAPEDTVDGLIARNQISATIPEIRRKALEVYSQIFDSTEKGLQNIAGLRNYYQTYYPDFYRDHTDEVESAVLALQNAYQQNVYPGQNSDWTSHPNNVGHKDSPGCFRCHDGEHLNANNEAIRLECNLCHAIPVVAGPQDFVADLEISRGPEPESHTNPNWISLHHDAFNDSCSTCHTTEDAGGTSNTSFCSNSACHGSAWDYAGFDAPGLRELLLPQIPPTPTPLPLGEESALTFDATIGPLFVERCSGCHGAGGGVQNLDLTSYSGVLQGGVSGPAIVPGDPQASLLVEKQSGEKPHFSQLTAQELELVTEWITAGAPEK